MRKLGLYRLSLIQPPPQICYPSQQRQGGHAAAFSPTKQPLRRTQPFCNSKISSSLLPTSVVPFSRDCYPLRSCSLTLTSSSQPPLLLLRFYQTTDWGLLRIPCAYCHRRMKKLTKTLL